MNDPSAMSPVIQTLMLIIGALLTVLSTVAIGMQMSNKKALKELANSTIISFNEVARDVKDLGEKFAAHALLVARDYMTHAQHIEFHRIEGKIQQHD